MKSIWELAGGDTEVGRKMDALVEEALGSVTEARQQEQLAQPLGCHLGTFSLQTFLCLPTSNCSFCLSTTPWGGSALGLVPSCLCTFCFYLRCPKYSQSVSGLLSGMLLLPSPSAITRC